MKAYYLSIHNDDDQGQAIVFADSIKEAKRLIYNTGLDYDSYIDIRAKRQPAYDNLEHLNGMELANLQWKDGWIWFDYETPSPEDTTDEEFYKWYKKTILGVEEHE